MVPGQSPRVNSMGAEAAKRPRAWWGGHQHGGVDYSMDEMGKIMDLVFYYWGKPAIRPGFVANYWTGGGKSPGGLQPAVGAAEVGERICRGMSHLDASKCRGNPHLDASKFPNR